MSTTDGRRGFFLTFEGMDGSGKSTQLRLLASRLRRKSRDVVETAEPGGTEIGRQIRRIFLAPETTNLTPMAELLLVFAARAQHIEQVIGPALAQNKIVLCDRFTDSSIAYQGFGRELGEPAVLALDRFVCGGFSPDLTICLALDLESSLARARAREKTKDESRIDTEALAFHQRVREGYRSIAAKHPDRFQEIDGSGDPAAVAERVWTAVREHLPPPDMSLTGQSRPLGTD